MEFVTYSDLNKDIVNSLYKIPEDIDIIVGIPRSGMLVATMIALYLNKPVTDIDSYLNRRIYANGLTKNTKKIINKFDDIKSALVVEDSVDSGRSMILAKKKIDASDIKHKCVYFATYVRSNSKSLVDVYARVIDDERLFEWNFMHHKILEHACVDVDGVLCIDPTEKENDDGEQYIHFIKNAPQKLVPTRKIGWIISSRLEKYQKETEIWLHKNGIDYENIILMKGVTANERKKSANHGIFKANLYKNIKDAELFIESNPTQAQQIAEISHKPVYCVDNHTFYNYGITNIGREKRIEYKNKIKKIMPSGIMLIYHKLKSKIVK